MTIRSVAQELGYASPPLYEHFRDKEDPLTQIAVDELGQLEARLADKLPSDHRVAVVNMLERYWTFMLEHTQLHRLVNGMDGVPIDGTVVGRSAQSLCRVVANTVRPLSVRTPEKPMVRFSLMSSGLYCTGFQHFLRTESRRLIWQGSPMPL